MTRKYYGVVILIVLAMVLLVVLGMYETAEAPGSMSRTGGVSTVSIQASEPTDFVQVGNLSFDAPGNRQDTPYLVYDEPGAPGRSVELVMDPLSFCVTESGAFQCIAMSASYSIPFGGKRAVVDGTRQGDGRVLVRTLRIVGEHAALNTEAGRRYIAWPVAEELIRTCAAREIMQAHSLDISIRLADGSEYYTVEPVIDAVFALARETERRCDEQRIGTE